MQGVNPTKSANRKEELGSLPLHCTDVSSTHLFLLACSAYKNNRVEIQRNNKENERKIFWRPIRVVEKEKEEEMAIWFNLKKRRPRCIAPSFYEFLILYWCVNWQKKRNSKRKRRIQRTKKKQKKTKITQPLCLNHLLFVHTNKTNDGGQHRRKEKMPARRKKK